MKNTLKLIFFVLLLFALFVSLRMFIDVAFYSDVIGIKDVSILGIISILFTVSAFLIGCVIFLENRHPSKTYMAHCVRDFSGIWILRLFIIRTELSEEENVPKKALLDEQAFYNIRGMKITKNGFCAIISIKSCYFV